MIISYDNDRFEENITPSRVSFLFVSVVAGASLGHFTNLYQALLACAVFMLDTGLVFRDSDWAKAIMLSAVMLVFYVLQARAKLVNSVLATARREVFSSESRAFAAGTIVTMGTRLIRHNLWFCRMFREQQALSSIIPSTIMGFGGALLWSERKGWFYNILLIIGTTTSLLFVSPLHGLFNLHYVWLLVSFVTVNVMCFMHSWRRSLPFLVISLCSHLSHAILGNTFENHSRYDHVVILMATIVEICFAVRLRSASGASGASGERASGDVALQPVMLL